MKQVTGAARILVVHPQDEIEAQNKSIKLTDIDSDSTVCNTSSGETGHPSTPKFTPKTEPNRIEINIDAKSLGFSIIGGCDTPLVRYHTK